MTSQERPAGRGQRKDDVLRELRADGALTAAELVERTSLSRPTIISLLRELEEDGWVSSEVGGHGAPDGLRPRGLRLAVRGSSSALTCWSTRC